MFSVVVSWSKWFLYFCILFLCDRSLLILSYVSIESNDYLFVFNFFNFACSIFSCSICLCFYKFNWLYSLSLLVLNTILLTSWVNMLCFFLRNLFRDFNVNTLLLMNSFRFSFRLSTSSLWLSKWLISFFTWLACRWFS